MDRVSPLTTVLHLQVRQTRPKQFEIFGHETPPETTGKDKSSWEKLHASIARIHSNRVTLFSLCFFFWNRLVGLVVRRPPRERKIPGSNAACAGIFSGSSHTSDLKIGTLVATLSGAWRYRVSTGTGRPGVSILWLGEVERLICNFCLSVAARKIVWADPSLRYTSLLLGR